MFLHQDHIYTDLYPSASLEQFLTAIWGAVFQAAVLILPQIKLNLQSSCCAFFKSTDEWSISLTYSFLHVKNHNLITYTSSPKRFCSMNRTPEAPDHQPLVMAHVLIHIIQHVTRIIQAKLYHLYYYIYIYICTIYTDNTNFHLLKECLCNQINMSIYISEVQ